MLDATVSRAVRGWKPEDLRRLARDLSAEADRREAARTGRSLDPGFLRVTRAQVEHNPSNLYGSEFWRKTSCVWAVLEAEDGKYRYRWQSAWSIDEELERTVPSQEGCPESCTRALLDRTRPEGIDLRSRRDWRKHPPAEWRALAARARKESDAVVATTRAQKTPPLEAQRPENSLRAPLPPGRRHPARWAPGG